MSKWDTADKLKRLRSNYKLVLMNEDSFEEVVKFRLSRLSVYFAMSSLFVILVALTASLIIFTPLKYYLPGVGYGNAKQMKEFRKLKMRTDSMERALQFQHRYLDDIQQVLKGNIVKLDTNKLSVPKLENIDE